MCGARLPMASSSAATTPRSKNLDDGSAWNTSVSGNTPAFVEFPLNPKLDWGPAATDVRHAASINGSYELPFGPQPPLSESRVRAGELCRRADGRRARSSTLQTGFPFSPQLGYNPTGNGDTRNPVRPNWNPNFTGTLYPHTPSQYFNPTAFLPPATGTYGNVSRDSLTGPGLSELDFSATQECAHHRAAWTAVPRGVLQHPQPHQFPRRRMRWSTPRRRRAFRRRRAWSRPLRPRRDRFSLARSCSFNEQSKRVSCPDGPFSRNGPSQAGRENPFSASPLDKRL